MLKKEVRKLIPFDTQAIRDVNQGRKVSSLSFAREALMMIKECGKTRREARKRASMKETI